jgi:hypothetical protein
MAKASTWIVNSITTKKSKYGGMMEEIVFIDIKTREQIKSYLDPENRNYHKWNSVLAGRDDGMIVGGLKTSVKNDKTIINADSVPEIVWQGSKTELADTIAEVWSKPPSTYESLFE